MSDDQELPERCPPAPWPFVEVRWEDSANDHQWVTEENAPDTIEIVSRGWRISDTKRQIKLAASYYHSDKRWFFGEVIAIPRKAIIEVIPRATVEAR